MKTFFELNIYSIENEGEMRISTNINLFENWQIKKNFYANMYHVILKPTHQSYKHNGERRENKLKTKI